MTTLELSKLIYSVVTLLVIHLLSHLLKRAAKQTQQTHSIKKSRYFAIKRGITTTALLLSLIALVLIWKVDIKNAWVSLTGVLALIAIAFFAVWSLVGNILAGFIIYFTSPFKIEDTIDVMPDAVCGKVLAINTFYTVLQDADNNYINVPNSLFFQKYIRVVKSLKRQNKALEDTSQ